MGIMDSETTTTGPTTVDPVGATRAANMQLGALSVGHAVIDSYGHTLLAPMFPVLKDQLQLTYGQIGALPIVMGFTASLAQPLIGVVTDRWPRIPAVAMGPAIAGIFMGLISFAPNYLTLASCLFFAGIGIGAFHPQGAALASRAARGRGFAMSAFTVGGNIGFGVAPLLGDMYYKLFGLGRFYVASLPGLVFAVWMLSVLWRPGNRLFAASGRTGSEKLGSGNVVALALLTCTVAVRAGVQIATSTFMAFLLRDRSMQSTPESTAGIAISIYLLATAISGPIGGMLSDRFGRRAVMIGSLTLAPFIFHGALRLDGWYMVAGLAAGGFVLMLPHPANVVMAQEYMPLSAGLAASMITGLAWALGQFLSWPLGILAERSGVEAALSCVYWLPLAGTVLALPLGDRRND
jgi:FSR family fosmidomycin resistance protein-like MFS transporter